MSKAIERIKTHAEELAEIRRLIHEIEDAAKEKLEPLKAKREEVQAALIAAFNKEGITSIKTGDGDTYSKSVRKGVEVTSEAHALSWAIENRAVKIDLIQAKQKLGEIIESGDKLPDGFEEKQVEYISIRGAKAKNEKESKV